MTNGCTEVEEGTSAQAVGHRLDRGVMRPGGVRHGWTTTEAVSAMLREHHYLGPLRRWGGNYFAHMLPPTMRWLVWDKLNEGMSLADCELAWTSQQNAARVFKYSRGNFNTETREHPTQKPLKLMEWCISHARKAATVCDPFMGSGTTGVACARMGLQFVGIERERKYFDIACRRIEQAYAQPRLFEDAKVGAGATAVQGDMLLPANVGAKLETTAAPK